MFAVGMLVVSGVVLSGVIYLLYSAPSWRRWGATDEELNARYPHDELVPDAVWKAVRAITINAPPKDVWPWVAQVGRGGGWCAIDFLDNRGCKSADYLMDLPEPAIGDGNEVGQLAACRHGDHLAYLTPQMPFFFAKWRFCMGHVLRAVDADRTRLLLIVRVALAEGSPIAARPALWLNNILETTMGIAQLKNLKRLIETYPARLKQGEIHRVSGKHAHQKAAYYYAGRKTDQ